MYSLIDAVTVNTRHARNGFYAVWGIGNKQRPHQILGVQFCVALLPGSEGLHKIARMQVLGETAGRRHRRLKQVLKSVFKVVYLI